ncbi:MAG: hypothetical protein WCE75_04900 [Terracidiphilus sp.]
MALFAQHGHGKSDKIDVALDGGFIDGVVFGARSEKRENIESCVEVVREKNGQILFDPQFHVSTIMPANDRHLPDYPYYKAARTAADFVGIKKLGAYVKSTLDFELGLQPDRLLSPTVIFESFSSNWYQTALNLADASLDFHAGLPSAPPLLLSFVIGEEALGSRVELEAFLDQVTSWENVFGLYVVISRAERSYSQIFDPERLANALYMSYVLGHINGLEVVNGYSDFCGILYRAVGSSAYATGWSQGLRQFHKRAFTKQKPGGQAPRLRYTSLPLLNSILLSELQQIHEVDRLDDALSGVSLDSVITEAESPEESNWNQQTSELHHWESLHLMDGELSGDVVSDVSTMEEKMTEAKELYVSMEEDGIIFGSQTRSNHLDQWAEAINKLRDIITL